MAKKPRNEGPKQGGGRHRAGQIPGRAEEAPPTYSRRRGHEKLRRRAATSEDLVKPITSESSQSIELIPRACAPHMIARDLRPQVLMKIQTTPRSS